MPVGHTMSRPHRGGVNNTTQMYNRQVGSQVVSQQQQQQHQRQAERAPRGLGGDAVTGILIAGRQVGVGGGQVNPTKMGLGGLGWVQQQTNKYNVMGVGVWWEGGRNVTISNCPNSNNPHTRQWKWEEHQIPQWVMEPNPNQQ